MVWGPGERADASAAVATTSPAAKRQLAMRPRGGAMAASPPIPVTAERGEPIPAPTSTTEQHVAKAAWPRLLKLALAVAFLAALYWAADWRAVATVLGSLDGAWLAAALVLFVPQTAVSAWRWQGLAGGVHRLSFTTALRQTLAASAVNLVVPSKLGDLSKAGMLPRQVMKQTAGLVMLEKGSDVAALLGLLVLGCLGIHPAALAAMAAMALVATAWGFAGRLSGGPSAAANGALRSLSSVRRAAAVASSSMLLWMLHLAQFDLFLRAAGVEVSAADVLARVPVAIFAGLIPLTLWGVGTRDGALVWLFADMAAPAVMAGVGLLTALRYIVPGVAGIACLRGVWKTWAAASS